MTAQWLLAAKLNKSLNSSRRPFGPPDPEPFEIFIQGQLIPGFSKAINVRLGELKDFENYSALAVMDEAFVEVSIPQARRHKLIVIENKSSCDQEFLMLYKFQVWA